MIFPIFVVEASAQKPHYNITTDVTYPPFEFQKKNGTYTGIDVEIIRAIAKKKGFTMTLKPISFNSGAQMVLSGQMDGIIAAMTITSERKFMISANPITELELFGQFQKNHILRNFLNSKARPSL